MKQIKLFGLNGVMCDLNNILDKLDEDFNDNIQWINDCLQAAKIRAQDCGTLVPVTPKGRPKTRLFLKKRALQLELVNRLNFSHKSGGSTPKHNKSVTVNVTPHYLNKSISLKKKLLAKAIKNSGKKAKEKTKNIQPDPIRTVLFKSPDVGTKKPATTVSGGDVKGAPTNAANQEVKKTTGKTRGRTPKPKAAEKVESKPVVRKGRPRLPPMDEKLKVNLESLVDNLLSPIKTKPAPRTAGRPAKEKQTEVLVFKSPTKEVKSKIDTGLDAVMRKKAASKLPAVKNICEEEGNFEECETVEVCDKSLQISLPPLEEPSENLKADLNPRVQLVDIGIGLSNAMKHNPVKVSGVVDSTGEYYSASDNKSAERTKALPNIYSSTPAHKNPNQLLMLQKLNLTRISMGGSPPGRTLDRSDVSYEVPQPRQPLHPTTTSDPVIIDDSYTKDVAEKAKSHASKDREVPKAATIAKAAPTVHSVSSSTCNPKNKVMDYPQTKPHSQNNQVPAVGCMPLALVTQTIESESRAIHTVSPTKSATKVATPTNDVCGKGTVSDSPSVQVVEEVSSYEMTPVRKNKKFLPSTANDYNIRDLDSDDSTDDEQRPRKVIPAWARASNLKDALIRQSRIPLDEIHKMFDSVIHENLNLKEIFASPKRHFRKRTSSACWDHPPLKKPRF